MVFFIYFFKVESETGLVKQGYKLAMNFRNFYHLLPPVGRW